jgi:hypothetical protein
MLSKAYERSTNLTTTTDHYQRTHIQMPLTAIAYYHRDDAAAAAVAALLLWQLITASADSS